MDKNDRNVLTGTEKVVLKPNSQFSVLPLSGSKGVSTLVNPLITFNEQIQGSTMNSKNIILLDNNGHVVPAIIETFDVNNAAIVPNALLKPLSHYRIKFGTGLRDLKGKNIIISDRTTSFQTGEK